MKINTPVKINITLLKPELSVSVDKVIVPELVSAGAIVSGKKDEHGDKIMIINGDIEMEDIEDIFTSFGVDVDDFVVTDLDMIPDYDDVEVFDALKNNVKGKKINEKKENCCPPKKKVVGNIVNLSEALNGKVTFNKNKKVADLNTVIDSISGKCLSESVKNVAMKKAETEFLKDKLGADKFASINESVSINAQSMHADTKINGKRIAEYSTDELKTLLKKVDEQIDALNKKVASGINEADGDKKIEETLAVKNKIKTILLDEIDFRDAMSIREENENADAPSMEFKNLNPNVSDDEANKNDAEPKNESDDDSDKHDDSDETSDADDKNDDEQNPDEDEVVELGSVVITLASEDAANDLKQDLLDAGVPEDAIEIEPVEDEEEISDEDETESESDENEESSETDNAEEEHPEESVKPNGKNSVNEDDENSDDSNGDDNSSDENASDNAESDENSDASEDTDGDDKAYKLILTDTDYVSDLEDVLENIWGMEKSEFEDMIGGEVVTDDSDEDSEKSDDEESDDKSDSEESEEDDEFADFDPDEIFKDL